MNEVRTHLEHGALLTLLYVLAGLMGLLEPSVRFAVFLMVSELVLGTVKHFASRPKAVASP